MLALLLMAVPLTEVAAMPIVTTVSPTQGSMIGGTSVTISGSGFTGATDVRFGGTAAASFSVVSDTEITATTAAHAVGLVDVTVTVAATGIGTLGGGYTYVATVPDAPTIGAATAGNAAASVSFTAPSNNGGSTITGYTVTSSPGSLTATGTSSPITVTGLTNGTAYTFTVTATNAAGTSVASAASNAMTPKGIQFIAFTNPGTQTFGTTRTLTATSTSGLAPTFTSSTTSVCTVTSAGALTFVTAGWCSISADQAGNAAWDPASTLTQSFSVVAVVADAPTIGMATAGNASATVTFAAPANTGGLAITGYTVTSSPSGLTAGGTSSPITVTGLANGTTYTFTVTASTTAGTSSASAASNAVTPGAGSPTIALAASSTSVVSGGSVTLTATLSGGSSPTGTVTFMDGATTLGTGTVSGGSASYTAAGLADGTHAITAVYGGDANNGSATSSAVSVTVSAAARPDPSQDPTVTAMVTAQVASSARFGQTQITNTVQRLEQLHEEPVTSSAADSGHGQTASAGSGYAATALAYGSGASPESTSTDTSSASQAVGQLSRGLEAAERKAGLPFHLWSSGSIDWGRTDANGDDRFTSSGFTVGVDRRMTDSLTMGLAGGLAVDHTTFGSDDNWSDGTAYTAQLYASLKLAPQTWLDLVGGYGSLQFDSARWSSGSQLDGSRDGHDLFGSVGLSTVREVSGLKLTGYGRLDIVKVALDGYAESGPASLALAYDGLDTTTLAGVAGLKAGYGMPMSWGTLTPGGRLEYRHALDGGFTQSLGYADVGGFGYTISGDSSTRDSATLGLSLDATTLDGLDLDLEYQLSADGDGVASQQVRAGVRLPF